jgi:MFS family permease
MSDVPDALRSAPRRPFQFRDFRLYALAMLVSTIAMQMQSVAIGWQVYALTGSALSLGYVGLAQFAPAILLSFATGHAADRFERRHVLAICHALLASSALGLFWLVQSTTTHRVGFIYALLVLVGGARAFQAPASQALTPNLVPLAHFPSAVAWTSSIWQISVVGGPALGGLLYAAGGGGLVYGVATALEIAAVGLLLGLRVKTTRARAANSVGAYAAGLHFVRRHPVILGALSLDLFAVLLGGAVALLPIYARDILHVGPQGLGLLRSAPAVGALVVAVVLAFRPLERRSGMTMLACVAIFGVATVGFGVSRSFPTTLFALALAGAADMVSVYIRHALVQLNTPDTMRGRVAAINMIFIGASNELGEFESGLAASWLGAVPAVVLGGVGSCLVVVVCALLFPELRRADRLVLASDPGREEADDELRVATRSAEVSLEGS